MSEMIDDASADVAAAIRQLQSGASEPASSVDDLAARAVAEHDNGSPEAAVERVSRRVADAIAQSDPKPERRERVRDSAGRFAKSDSEPQQEPARAQPSSEVERIAERVAAEVGQGRDRPSTPLNKQEREWLAGQDAAVQEQVAAIIERLEAANQRGFQSFKANAGDKDLEAILAPRRASFRANGYKSDAAALQNLMAWSDHIERDPVG